MSNIRRDFAPGVITGADVKDLFALAKAEQFALPAANCTGSNTINGVIETAARLNSPVIIQFSYSGVGVHRRQGCGQAATRSSILGAIAGARHVNTLAEAYGARVILHTDHCAKDKLGWVDGLLDAGEEYFAANGRPLFSSHMLDLSEEPMDENVATCKKYLERMTPMGMTLEIELGITGGEEDGVDNTGVDQADLYSKPEEVEYAYRELMEVERPLHDRRRVRQRPRRLQAGQRQAAPEHPARQPGVHRRQARHARPTSRSTSSSTAGRVRRPPRSPRRSPTASSR